MRTFLVDSKFACGGICTDSRGKMLAGQSAPIFRKWIEGLKTIEALRKNKPKWKIQEVGYDN